MKQWIKATAFLVLAALSFVVLVEVFACPEEHRQASASPVECCLQCCPRHHMAPPSVQLTQIHSTPLFEYAFHFEFSPRSVLLSESVFHPPRA